MASFADGCRWFLGRRRGFGSMWSSTWTIKKFFLPLYIAMLPYDLLNLQSYYGRRLNLLSYQFYYTRERWKHKVKPFYKYIGLSNEAYGKTSKRLFCFASWIREGGPSELILIYEHLLYKSGWRSDYNRIVLNKAKGEMGSKFLNFLRTSKINGPFWYFTFI